MAKERQFVHIKDHIQEVEAKTSRNWGCTVGIVLKAVSSIEVQLAYFIPTKDSWEAVTYQRYPWAIWAEALACKTREFIEASSRIK